MCWVPERATERPDKTAVWVHPHRTWRLDTQSSPVSIERGLVLPSRVQGLIGVHGHGCPDTLVGTLQRLIVGCEDVHAAGHPGRGEVR